MYSIKYKLKSQLFWRSIKDIKGDTSQSVLGHSHLLLIRADESLTLLPIEGAQFKFSKERHYAILKKMEAESGQKITLRAE